MITIFEILLNARYNLCEGKTPLQKEIGKQQLNNAMNQLEDGAGLSGTILKRSFSIYMRIKKFYTEYSPLIWAIFWGHHDHIGNSLLAQNQRNSCGIGPAPKTR